MDSCVLDALPSKAIRRPDVDTLLRRAIHLPPRDEAILRWILGGLTVRETGRLVGIQAGTVSRRFNRLINRLIDPFVVALIERPEGITPEDQQLGIEHALLGRSVRELAVVHRTSEGEVRASLAFVRGWFQGLSHARGIIRTPLGAEARRRILARR